MEGGSHDDAFHLKSRRTNTTKCHHGSYPRVTDHIQFGISKFTDFQCSCATSQSITLSAMKVRNQSHLRSLTVTQTPYRIQGHILRMKCSYILLSIRPFCPLLRISKCFVHSDCIPWFQSDFKVSRNGHQSSLDGVIINVVRVRRFALTRNYPVRRN